ncbi:MAG: hypothetical protein NTZ90_17045 [Proteobacteria bacterium]|nr:hypothetical protein [Pseudomonadota bacterium]
MTSVRRLCGVTFGAFLLVALTACQTQAPNGGGKQAEKKDNKPPPVIYANMDLEKAVAAGIDFGGDTLTNVKRLIKRRNLTEPAYAMVAKVLHENIQSYEHNQLINAGHLYASLPLPVAPAMFHDLVGSGRPLAQQLGWQLAAVKPSPQLVKVIENELTRAIADNDEDSVLVPQMANAVRANHLRDAYTLLRQGLMSKGDEEFALGMIALNPSAASDDFLPYLALPPAEELRQLTMSSVNLYTCITILKHLQKVPPAAGKPGFDHLLFYAVSRNPTLAELAQGVLEQFLPEQTEYLAQMLARQPAWVQIAYVESARRRMNPKEGLLLSELKKSTSENDVVQEISELKF